MKAIWKYPVKADMFTVDLPDGAEPLSVQVQNDGGPQMWVLVDPERMKHQRTFVTFGTGHPIPEATRASQFIGTFQLARGQLVFHLFEVELP